MERKREQALAFIIAHPRTFLMLTARRILFVWTGFWSLDARYLSSEPMQIPFAAFNLTFSVLIAAGFVYVWHRCRWMVFPLSVLTVCQPLVYYITHPAIEYRHAIDPALVLLGAAGVGYVMENLHRLGWINNAEINPGTILDSSAEVQTEHATTTPSSYEHGLNSLPRNVH